MTIVVCESNIFIIVKRLKLIPWSRFRFGKLIVLTAHLYVTQRPMSKFGRATTGTHPESVEFSPCCHTAFLQNKLSYDFSHLLPDLPCHLFFPVFRPSFCMPRFSDLSHVCFFSLSHVLVGLITFIINKFLSFS